jgi:hypothetical protein
MSIVHVHVHVRVHVSANDLEHLHTSMYTNMYIYLYMYINMKIYLDSGINMLSMCTQTFTLRYSDSDSKSGNFPLLGLCSKLEEKKYLYTGWSGQSWTVFCWPTATAIGWL